MKSNHISTFKKFKLI